MPRYLVTITIEIAADDAADAAETIWSEIHSGQTVDTQVDEITTERVGQ